MRLIHLDDDWLELFQRRAKSANSRARKKNCEGSITAQYLAEAFVHQQGKCIFCEDRLFLDTVSVEHFVSMSHGGDNYPDNVALSCVDCNNKRSNEDNRLRDKVETLDNPQEAIERLALLEERAAQYKDMRLNPIVRQKLHFRIAALIKRLNSVGIYV